MRLVLKKTRPQAADEGLYVTKFNMAIACTAGLTRCGYRRRRHMIQVGRDGTVDPDLDFIVRLAAWTVATLDRRSRR